MPIDPAVAGASALKFLGLNPEEFDDEKALHAAIEDGFIPANAADTHPNIAKRMGGMKARINGSFRSELDRWAKELGVEIPATNAEGKELDAKDGVGVIVNALLKREAQAKKELEEAKTDGSSKAEVDRLKAELELAKSNVQTFGQQLEEERGKYTKLTEEVTAKEERERLDKFYGEAVKDIPWKAEKTKVEDRGYDAALREFKPKFDEKGEVEYVIGPDGKPVPDTTKHGAFKAMSQIALDLATTEKMVKLNPQGGRQVGGNGTNKNTAAMGGNGMERPAGHRQLADQED